MKIPYQQLMGAVDDAEVIIPAKRKPDPNAEWRLQAKCVKILRKECRINKDLRFLAPMPERKRDAKQAAIAKMMGLQSGPPDLWLFLRTHPGCKIWLVELKKPGKPLSDEQKDWFEWSPWPCHRVDNLADFAQVLVRFLATPRTSPPHIP